MASKVIKVLHFEAESVDDNDWQSISFVERVLLDQI